MKQKNGIPRIMIAAPASSSGKTTLTCALLELLKKRGKNPVSFKCGPDFIDPMFHERVLGVPSNNLDSFFCSEGQVQEIFTRNSLGNGESQQNCAVIEGVMGLFDGLAGKSLVASSYDIARITKTPILLVIDATGMSRSIVPLIKGFLSYDKENSNGENLIKAVFLNKASKSQFELLKPQIENECGIKVAGFLPKTSQIWQSRHLGLILPSEIQNLKKEISETADILCETLDFSVLEKIMLEDSFFGDFKGRSSLGEGVADGCREGEAFPKKTFNLTLAVAYDEAFCFYYRENLRVLEEMGAKIKYFSPLHDTALPSEADGILLGGGYPELYAAQIEANESMRRAIKSAVKNGMSVMAECGGFMFLQEKLSAQDGKSYEMCGAIEGESHYTGKLVRFGYAEFSPNGTLFGNEIKIKGHEFHYFDSTNNGTAFTAKKPLSNRSWDCMINGEKILAGFPHLYYCSCPNLVEWFLNSCKKV